MAEQWAIILAVVGGIVIFIALGVGIIVLCNRYRRWRKNRISLLKSEPGVRGSYGTSAKLWEGGSNPTEDLRVEILGGRTRKPFPEETRNDEEIRRLLRICSNYCRSTTHERMLKAPLPHMGRRSTKFYTLCSDARVNQTSLSSGGSADVNALLTMISTDDETLLPLKSPKLLTAWKSLLISLHHPCILPTYDAGVSIDGQQVFILRDWCEEGSLRDALFLHHHPPSAGFGAKYLGSDPMTGLTFVRPARALKIELVAKYARQIIEGCRYLESQGVPFFHLHTGNVALVKGNAVLTDYENAFIGYRHRLQKKLRRLPGVDPQLAAFVCLLYEISTGIEPQVMKRAAGGGSSSNPLSSPSSDGRSSPAPSSPSSSSSSITLDLIIKDPRYADVHDLIQRIVSAAHSVTFDEILAHALFRNLKASTIPREPPRPLDSRTCKLLQPILTHYSTTLFPGHPNHCGITLPVKIASPGGDASPAAGNGSAGRSVDSISVSVEGTPNLGSSVPASPSSSPRSKDRKKLKKKRERSSRTPIDLIKDSGGSKQTSDDEDGPMF
jgi:serine/threonine protein kinase